MGAGVSRGLGTLQRRVLDALAAYERLGPALGWRWPGGARYTLGSYVWPDEYESDRWVVEDYERGRRVPMWILRRDLECSRSDLSRALRSLERRGFIWTYAGDLDVTSYEGRNRKFAGLTPEGHEWLNRQQSHSGKVGAYGQRRSSELNHGQRTTRTTFSSREHTRAHT